VPVPSARPGPAMWGHAMTEIHDPARAASAFSIGDVLGTTFGVRRHNFLGFVLLAVVVSSKTRR